MKRLFITSMTAVALVFLASAVLASAAEEATLAAEIRECFRLHGLLMDKPALRNERRCWQTHAHLRDGR